jgi:hypothetical protein
LARTQPRRQPFEIDGEGGERAHGFGVAFGVDGDMHLGCADINAGRIGADGRGGDLTRA